MSTINDKVKALAPDLTTKSPASPHAMLGGYILAKRAVDKARADIAGTVGDYHTDCPLDHIFLDFAEIKYADFRAELEKGASDEEMGTWVAANAKKREKIDIIKWNNDLRYKRVSELQDGMQEFFESYIPANVKPEVIHHVRYFFDVFDAEEGRFSK